MRKRLIVTAVVLLALAVGGWWLVFSRAGRYIVRQGVPADAVFVVETPSFNRLRDKLYGNRIWTSLKEYPYFEAYHEQLQWADSLCEAYPVLRRMLTDRPFAVSCHLTSSGEYDLLYVCDLGKLNVLQTVDGLMGSVAASGQLTRLGEMTEVAVDGQKWYYAIAANLLLASSSSRLVEAGLNACGQVAERWTQTGELRLGVDHPRLEKWWRMLMGKHEEKAEPSSLERTVATVQFNNEALYLKGETYPSRRYFSLLSALNLVEGSRSQVKDIVSEHTAAYVSLCYSSFQELEAILLENYKISHLKEVQEYERTLKRWNKFLGLRLEEVFTSWMGNEIAIIKPAMDKENRPDDLVLAIRSADMDLAKDQLAYLAEQIDSRTPVRMRMMEYNGHVIGYLSLKGIFRLFLGALFEQFDRPYYTFIGDYVVFSNSATVLASMIKDYSLGKTLAQDEKYNALMEQLGNRNNVYGYIRSPETYAYLCRSLEPSVRTEFMKNKGAFQSFESVGFALANAGSGYETRLIACHNGNAAADYELRELNRTWEAVADRVESGYYLVVLPDSVAVSTRGAYAYERDGLKYSGRLGNGTPDGVWNISDMRGNAVAQYIYRTGVPQGEARFFYPNGVVKAQADYEQGKITAYKEFFSDGTLKVELKYNRGRRHGEARFYYSTGHLWGEGKYRKGRRSGTWRYYRVTGEVERKMKY